MKNFCFVGHACLDIINGKFKQEGGACIYGAALVQYLVNHVSIVTAIAQDFPKDNYSNIEWIVQPSDSTTVFRHSYKADHRFSHMETPAKNIDSEKIPERIRSADTVILCPIVHEITPDMVDVFTSDWIGLLPQGWFRSFDSSGVIRHSQSIFHKLPKKIKLIVISEEDAKNDSTAWSWILAHAEIAVCTLGKKGYILSVNKIESTHQPKKIFEVKDSTGCGDIFATSLLYLLRNGFSPKEAAEKAGYAAGLASTQIGIAESAKIAADYLVRF